MNNTQLSVNVNKIAHLRNTRHLDIPNVVAASRVCLMAGAHGITVHPRPDERHIRKQDVYDVATLMREFPNAEYNIEGNPLEDRFMQIVRELRPTQCTLVPDSPDQFTSDHGWDTKRDAERLKPIVAELHELGCRVSLFLDADPEMVPGVIATGADRIELYTESFASKSGTEHEQEILDAFVETARLAQDQGLGVNAGHDLNQENLGTLLKAIPWILEVSIGHALVAEALFDGLHETVQSYLAIIERSRT